MTGEAMITHTIGGLTAKKARSSIPRGMPTMIKRRVTKIYLSMGADYRLWVMALQVKVNLSGSPYSQKFGRNNNGIVTPCRLLLGS